MPLISICLATAFHSIVFLALVLFLVLLGGMIRKEEGYNFRIDVLHHLLK
jgi:hypothetical protein